jgi:predicted metal-binding membrane protein
VFVVARDTSTRAVVFTVGLATAAAWVAFVRMDMMTTRPIAFLAAWTAMMTAMMLPSAVPLVLVHGRRGRGRLIAGYLLVWAAAGIPVLLLAKTSDLMMVPDAAVAAVLVAAGVYQFTPLKDVCLKACRSPLDFVAMRWGRGSLRLGIDHGAYCVGCCWALMAVLVVAAAMSVAAAAVIAAVVFAEKVLPGGFWLARAGGLALLVAAVFVVL